MAQHPKIFQRLISPTGGLGFMLTSYTGKVRSVDQHYPKFSSTGKDNQYRSVQRKGGNWGSYYQFPPWNDSVGTKMESIQKDAFNYHWVVPDHAKSFTNPGLD